MDGSAAVQPDGGKSFAIGLVALALILAFILAAPLILPLDPEAMSPEFILTPPSSLTGEGLTISAAIF